MDGFVPSKYRLQLLKMKEHVVFVVYTIQGVETNIPYLAARHFWVDDFPAVPSAGDMDEPFPGW